MNISNQFKVYKLGNALYQIGELDIDSDYKFNIISLLEFGNKFVPNYFFNPLDYFNYLLSELDTNLLDLNKNFFFLNNNNKVHNNIKNYYNDNNLNEIKVDNQHIMSMFFNLNKTKPNKVDNNNLYISKEINDIRSFIQNYLIFMVILK